MRKANYDKAPATEVEGKIFLGWEAILSKLKAENRPAVAVEVYPGAYEDALAEAFGSVFGPVLRTRSLMKPEAEIRSMTLQPLREVTSPVVLPSTSGAS